MYNKQPLSLTLLRFVSLYCEQRVLVFARSIFGSCTFCLCHKSVEPWWNDPWTWLMPSCCCQYQQGLIQMNILPRLRYILEVCCPGASTVYDILDILTRITQHSTQSANEVLRCPRLMEAILANFLPLSWKASELKSGIVHGQPVSAAMRLARVICCAGRHMAATLVSWAKVLIMQNRILSPIQPLMWLVIFSFIC